MTSDNRSYVWETCATYGFPMVMFALAIIPGLNYLYSGHGGIAWFFVPLCFPYVVLRALLKITLTRGPARQWYKVFFVITIPSYIILAFPLSWAATTSIRETFGLPIPVWSFLGLMVSPVPWWYFT